MHRIALALLGVLALLVPAAGAAPRASQGECRVIEDFRAGAVGEHPPDWKLRRDQGGRRFL
ncbi:MAG: hypothetical protein ACREJG_11710, partial [Candidatus Rokuibacteriota bacterium]